MNRKLSKGKINYIVDMAAGAALIVSAISGIMLLFLPSGSGFQGGRNAAFAATVLGMDRWFIKDLHSISSIVMAAGVLAHLVLHWNWIKCMTRKVFKREGSKPAVQCEAAL